MARDWGQVVSKMHDDHDRRAEEEEAKRAWGEFVAKFRRGDFDVEVRSGGRTYRFASWDEIDRYIRRG